MPYFLKGSCVWKGTEEKPGEQVKCHEDHAAAVAHMRALYANVEDAEEKAAWDAEIEKGGPGSGWHGPAEGTHTAENAPNFAGGPGADRKYGAEDEPAEGQKHCKCTKCDSTFTLPTGKQCEDVECPGCGGSATQTSPRKDPKAEGEGGGGGRGGKKKAMDAPGPQIHGEGGSMGEVSSVMDDEGTACKCPKCGKSLPCTAKACPHCKENIDRVDQREDERKAFTSYKAVDGTWRWMSLSSWAVVDKEREVVSEQAYKDAIAHAQETKNWGELDLVHINGTDVGKCDTLFILKGGDDPAKFGAGGTWDDTAKATRAREAIQADPAHWGMSLKFRYNPQRLVRGVYTGDIQVLKHSILPQEMAASYGTAIAVQGGEMSKQLDEKAAEALGKLGHTPEEIEELAEKNKALPEEENVVEKEEAAPEVEAPERAKVWAQLGQWLFRNKEATPVVASEPEEVEKTEEVTPAETKQVEDETPEVEKAEAPIEAGALMQALGEVVAKSIGEMVRTELDVRDKRISDLEAQIRDLGESIEEKVEQRLRDLPPVVKIAASQVDATVVEEKPKGLTFGQPTEQIEKFKAALLADIAQVVDAKTQGAGFTV